MTAQKHAVDDCSAQELYPLYTLRSEEHTSELQSHLNLVCRLLLEKKNIYNKKQAGSKLPIFTRIPNSITDVSVFESTFIRSTPTHPTTTQILPHLLPPFTTQLHLT